MATAADALIADAQDRFVVGQAVGEEAALGVEVLALAVSHHDAIAAQRRPRRVDTRRGRDRRAAAALRWRGRGGRAFGSLRPRRGRVAAGDPAGAAQ